jgi:SSS family solute:Na+ symporter
MNPILQGPLIPQPHCLQEKHDTHLLVGPGTKMEYVEHATAVLVSILGFPMWPHLFMKAYTAESERTLMRSGNHPARMRPSP